jgi:hypothetical protein
MLTVEAKQGKQNVKKKYLARIHPDVFNQTY